jgi:phosphate transport system substrate-binding protein
VAPSVETVSNGTYQPLSRPLFIYINKKAADKPEIKAFVKFYLENASSLAKEIGEVPLQQEVYKLAQSRFDNKITGTLFGEGKKTVGINMADLLKLEEQKK